MKVILLGGDISIMLSWTSIIRNMSLNIVCYFECLCILIILYILLIYYLKLKYIGKKIDNPIMERIIILKNII